MQTIVTPDVFISYHNSNNAQAQSSVPVAKKLEEFLKKRHMEPYFFPSSNRNDFYDDINYALLNSKNFLLVACNKEALFASEWVKSELKIFDSLRKNGMKRDACICAYIYGDISNEDMIQFNPIFSSVDIVRSKGFDEEGVDKEGFEKIYDKLTKNLHERNTDNREIYKETSRGKSDMSCHNELDDVSKLFLYDDLKNYSTFTDEEYLERCAIVTKRLKCMSREPVPDTCTNIIDEFYAAIIDPGKSASKYLLQLSGQSCTQKSYVLQLLYIRLMKSLNEHNFQPLYLNLDVARKSYAERAKTDISEMLDALCFDSTRHPLFLIDGIQNIICDPYGLDFVILNFAEQLANIKYITSKNVVFEDNPIRLNKSRLATSHYAIRLELSPISLYDKTSCLNYISTISGLSYSDIKSLYSILGASGLLNIDEHLVRIIDGAYDNGNLNIMDLFEQQLIAYFDGDQDTVSRAAQLVFKFAYTSEKIAFDTPLAIKTFNLVCENKIYLNCLIAIHFLNLLDSYKDNSEFEFMEAVFPKEITRFITKRIHSVGTYEDQLLLLAKHYNEMSIMGKSELSFFLGRIAGQNRQQQATEFLLRYYEETKQEIVHKLSAQKYQNQDYSYIDHKQDLFLLRGIAVSLIYRKNKKVLKEYLLSLINNDLSNSINRGFHLEYYGDIRYLPNQNTLMYEDNVALGERTLRVLCNDLTTQLQTNKFHPAALLELFTVVSLLQVRIEVPANKLAFDLTPYIRTACKLVEECLPKLDLSDNILLNFFMMATEDLRGYLENGKIPYDPCRTICNEYLKAPEVKRAGWVMQKIPSPESITEHMYACWFIALVYLPETDPENIDYCKQTILDMLLIHDIAETKLDDIPKYEKLKFPNYEQTENKTMLALLLKGTYNSIDTLTPYSNAWNEWYSHTSINAKIAKDIDVLQAVYQFLIYKKRYPQNFDDDRTSGWINELRFINTKQGQIIMQDLILQNHEFSEILNQYNAPPIAFN